MPDVEREDERKRKAYRKYVKAIALTKAYTPSKKFEAETLLEEFIE